MKRIFFFGLIFAFSFLFMGLGEAQNEQAGVKVFVGKNYGYFIGDLIPVVYRLSLPAGMVLREDELPKEWSEITEWLELREKKIIGNTVILTYQVFAAGSIEKPAIIPPVEFWYGKKAEKAANNVSAPAIPIIISPLTNDDSEFRNFNFPEFKKSTAGYFGAAGIILALFGVIGFYFSFRKFLKYSPFKDARRKASCLAANEYEKALILFRRSLNEKAGRAIFCFNLEDLFIRLPRARKHEPEISELIAVSDELSFKYSEELKISEDILLKKILRLLKNLRKCEEREEWALIFPASKISRKTK